MSCISTGIGKGSSGLSPTAHLPQVSSGEENASDRATFLTWDLSGDRATLRLGASRATQGWMRASGHPQGMAVLWEQAEMAALGWQEGLTNLPGGSQSYRGHQDTREPGCRAGLCCMAIANPSPHHSGCCPVLS